MDTHPISIVILDDHALVRAGLRLLIETHPWMKVVGEARLLQEGIDVIVDRNPDIVLLDLNISDQPSSAVFSEIFKACEGARIILVTGTNESSIAQQAVENGAMGVVFKTQSPEILIKAIEKVNSGEVWLERSMIANVLSRLSRNNKPKEKSADDNGIEKLSEREKQIVRLIGQGYKNKKISNQLCISETTVRHHLTSIYGKLGVTDRLELLVFAHRYGLVKQSNS